MLRFNQEWIQDCSNLFAFREQMGIRNNYVYIRFVHFVYNVILGI